MKRPLGFVALLYGGGLLLGEVFQPSTTLLFVISLALAAAALALPRFRPLLIAPLLLFAGWTNHVSHTAVLSPHDLRLRLHDAPELVAVRGRLVDTPEERSYVRGGRESFRTLARLDIVALERSNAWQAASGRIALTTTGRLPDDFFAGQEVEVFGIAGPPPLPVAEGLFDYRAYLRRQGIYFQLKAAGAADWRLLSAKRTRPLSDRFLAWGRATLARALPGEDEPLRLLWAMTLGWKTALTDEVSEPFTQSGTMHIFAISGLHIALIAGILVSLLRAFQVSRGWCGGIVIPLIWFYTVATGWQPSAIRSTVMMTVVVAGWSLKRPSDLINSLSGAAFIILLWDPQQLFQAGFQLSFLVVLSIALCLPPLEKIRDRLLQPDPLRPTELLPRWQRWLGGPLRWLTTSIATSLAAWLGSWPLTAHYFHLFSPVTLLANLLIVPLSSAALACNLGSLICATWFPPATELFNYSAWFWMWLITEISERVVALPGAFFYVSGPSGVDFAIYYGALFAMLSGAAFARKHRAWTLAAALAIAGFYAWNWPGSRPQPAITVIPLNGGHSVYVRATRRADDLLIDCGNTNSVEFVMKPFLHAHGVNRLPRLALTHGDLRSFGGAGALRAAMPIDEVVRSTARFRSPAYRRLMTELRDGAARERVVGSGDRINGWAVLHPADESFSHADDAALVLRGDISGTRVLLLSELGPRGQSALLERGGELRADIVVSGLPDQGEPLSDALLDAIQPKLIVIADSEFPAGKRAGAALRERLARRRLAVIYTRDAGAVTLELGKHSWKVRVVNGES